MILSQWPMSKALILLALLPCAAQASDNAGANDSAAQPPERSTTQEVAIPFTLQEIFGLRPVIAAQVNGRPFQLVVHANAGSYLQMNHADAAATGVRDMQHTGSYGIAAPGEVSNLGRDDGIIDSLAIGNWHARDVPVAVFEVPAGGSQGMLGLPWLHAAGVVMDFANHTITLSPAEAPRNATDLAAKMEQRGYSAHAMQRDPDDGRYLVMVTINGISAPMVVSSVAGTDLDSGFAQRAGLANGDISGRYGGPSGTILNGYHSATPVELTIGNWSADPQIMTIVDTYGYSAKQRPDKPEDERGGSLGADFLIRYRAVIDFGTRTLYLPAATTAP